MSYSRMQRGVNLVEKKLDFFANNPVFSVIVICGIALILRLYFFVPDIPIALDATAYFWYANDMSILGHFPSGHNVANNGWPTFLSVFFSIFHFNKAFDYMILQRLITILLSTSTVIPVYFLCKRFFDKPYAIAGTALFAFEPRIIQNSLQGLTEPLYILLIVITMVMFLSENKRAVYASFGIAALTSIVRAEGLFLFFSLSIMFLVRHRKERLVIPKYAISLAIFILILLPMVFVRIQTTGNDGLITRISTGSEFIKAGVGTDQLTHDVFQNLVNGLINLVRFLGWAMIPYFVFFAPIGALLVFKSRNYQNTTIMVILFIMLLPIMYAFTRFSDTRYLYPLYPIFVLFSLFTIETIRNKIKKRNLFLILLIGGLIISSWFFLNFKNIDIQHEKEALSIAAYVSKTTKVINEYYPEGKYLQVTRALETEKFPVLQSEITQSVKILPIFGFHSLEEYIQYGRTFDLSHLVLDNSNRNPDFLNEAFNSEEKYPYLIKEYDSWEHGYRYHVKIYRIDYDKFDLTLHSK